MREGGRLSPVSDAEFGQNGTHVPVGGFWTDVELGRDLGIAMARREQLKDVALAVRQPVWIGGGRLSTGLWIAAAQLRKALRGATSGSTGAEGTEGFKGGLHRGDITAELGDGRVIWAAQARPCGGAAAQSPLISCR